MRTEKQYFDVGAYERDEELLERHGGGLDTRAARAAIAKTEAR